MNERIRELALQAGGHISTRNLASNPVQYVEDVELWNDKIEKFAELIVRECLKLNKGQLVVIPKDQEDWDGHNYGFTAAVYGFEDLVKEYFGVEE